MVIAVVEEDEVVDGAVEETAAVETGVVALPAGKGAGVRVVEVAGGGTDTGVVEVEEVVAGGGTGVVDEVAGGGTGVEEVDVVLEEDEELELEPPVTGPVPVPTQGKVTM